MVIFYDIETKNIKRIEENTINPVLPLNMTIEEQKIFYKEHKEDFISLNEEIGVDIFNYQLVFNEKNEFLELKRKVI